MIPRSWHISKVWLKTNQPRHIHTHTLTLAHTRTLQPTHSLSLTCTHTLDPTVWETVWPGGWLGFWEGAAPMEVFHGLPPWLTSLAGEAEEHRELHIRQQIKLLFWQHFSNNSEGLLIWFTFLHTHTHAHFTYLKSKTQLWIVSHACKVKTMSGVGEGKICSRKKKKRAT